MRNIFILSCVAVGVISSQLPAAGQTFPEGPGKEILERECNACHVPDLVRTLGRSSPQWYDLVLEMKDEGAKVTDEELPVLVEYLAKNFPRKAAGAAPGAGGPPIQDPVIPSQADGSQAAGSAPGSTVSTGSQGITVIGCLQGSPAGGYTLLVTPVGGSMATGARPGSGANAGGSTGTSAETAEKAAATTYTVMMAAGGTGLATLIGQRVEVVGTAAAGTGAVVASGSAQTTASSSVQTQNQVLTAKTVLPVKGSCAR